MSQSAHEDPEKGTNPVLTVLVSLTRPLQIYKRI